MGRRKNKSDLEAENRYLRRTRLNEGFVQISLHLIRWGTIGYIARQIYLTIDSLAGKLTSADIGLDVKVPDIGVNFNVLGFENINLATVILAFILAISAILYALAQRKLRKDTVERLQKRIVELELKIDNKRSSSTLTTRGDTRPEDKI